MVENHRKKVQSYLQGHESPDGVLQGKLDDYLPAYDSQHERLRVMLDKDVEHWNRKVNDASRFLDERG
eukprot:CAMPEP_0185594486 /NCGR_PEP_ID=MMETSP0434-20130131/75070_1 /TAXON_ID=626734 ORGANISM="Favella taraikaensis, Strain Fe Narragansett Bay" /NCGR_SAMPLE_ID=MMETSP0434 /ASSEMBLY_ACC=CAM_ASM_000379 /LENGTH=67 /DNA_ID=CAMNT_0028221855 /DNA_START=111 /DNA_END=314 /DNA_ORIENTATION=+